MDNLDNVNEATLAHLEKCARILPGLPQFQISVNTTKHQISLKTPSTKQKKGKVKREVVCRFCFTSLPSDTSLGEYNCKLCNRKTTFDESKKKQALVKSGEAKQELAASIVSSKKKKKKVKEENAGLVIPKVWAPSASHDIKMKNQKKDKLMALLAKPAPKKESKLQDFLKLVQ